MAQGRFFLEPGIDSRGRHGRGRWSSVQCARIRQPKQHLLIFLVLVLVDERTDLERNFAVEALAPSLRRDAINIGLSGDGIGGIDLGLGSRPGRVLAHERTGDRVGHGKGEAAGRGLQERAGFEGGVPIEVARDQDQTLLQALGRLCPLGSLQRRKDAADRLKKEKNDTGWGGLMTMESKCLGGHFAEQN